MDLFNHVNSAYEQQLRQAIREIVREELERRAQPEPIKCAVCGIEVQPLVHAIRTEDLPLPGHQRFFKPNGIELRFMVGEKYWHGISDLNLDQLEAACAIASQWWEAETNRVTIAKMSGPHNGNIQPSECYANARRWRDYAQQEREVRK